MRRRLKEKISKIKERLLDPFDTEGLERDLEELLNILRTAEPEDRLAIVEDFEEVKRLLRRNLSIITGSLEPLVRRGGIFSRRV
jgi:hypothetical protein